MPNALYTRLAATAARLLQSYGADAVLRRTVQGQYDPATATSTDTVTNTTVRAAVFDYTNDEIDGTLILRTDKKAVISGSEPLPVDVLIWQGAQHRVVSATTISPAGQPVLYIAQVRRG